MTDELSPRPAMRVAAITLGAPAPRKLAAFYARLLGWPVTAEEQGQPGEPPEAGWAQVRPPDGQPGLHLNFEYEAQFTRPVWPSVPGSQFASQHLDIRVDDLGESVARATDAGATLADFQPQEHVRVMIDPAGHPFCLFL
jgi:catechol 2,3-dioxygenase-like lactoylglutathione lyase family enzyme